MRQMSLVECECGKIKYVLDDNLRSGRTASCGYCYHRGPYNHGDSSDRSAFSKLFGVWRGIKYRCKHKKHYFDRGITICDAWEKSYSEFKKWAVENGYRNGLSIDRINNDGNYEPSNCRWTTNKIQVGNRRCSIKITAFGETRTLAEWSELNNIPYSTLYCRIKSGMTPQEALS